MPCLKDHDGDHKRGCEAGGEGVTIGPILLGAARPVHVLTSTATVRRLVNMTALAVVESMER